MNQARLNGEGLSPASGLPWLPLDLDLDRYINICINLINTVKTFDRLSKE